jgi:hypothetical protein|tara:strand:+ start:4277 stop:4555 length:279 start_codon:yes stop_codon:yes gene_type:complete
MITTTISNYDSSTLKSAAYNYKHKTLLVHFNHASYLYKDVAELDWNLFNTAKSQGIALNAYIKGKYEFEKVEAEKVGSLLDELPPADYQMGN